jgi:heme exporter protein C
MSLTGQRYTKETGGGWLTPLALAAGVAALVGLGMVFFYAPLEASMGVVQKIFYFHVPSAIAAYMGFILCCVASIAYLLTGSARADVIARAGAEVGVLFCAAVLVSGPLWARKAWGTWWTGEPRLLLTLVLCLIFVAYLIVRSVGGSSEITRKICALLAILGVADIPIIRMAVDRWRGNHPEVLGREGGGITPEMGHVLMAMALAIALVFTVLVIQRVRVGLLEEDVETWHRALQPRRAAIDDLQRATGR